MNPGAFAAGITLITGTPEVIISCVKAALFGVIAGLVACYRGLMISGGGAKAGHGFERKQAGQGWQVPPRIHCVFLNIYRISFAIFSRSAGAYNG